MKTFRLFLIPAVLCTVGLAATVIAGVPKDKKTLTLDFIKGKKGAVKFEHAKHVDEHKVGDKKIVCKDCHHTLKKDTVDAKKVKGCRKCHVKEGDKQVEHDGKKARFIATMKGDKIDRKSVIFHERCLKACHKKLEDKKFGKCKTCHPKKK